MTVLLVFVLASFACAADTGLSEPDSEPIPDTSLTHEHECDPEEMVTEITQLLAPEPIDEMSGQVDDLNTRIAMLIKSLQTIESPVEDEEGT